MQVLVTGSNGFVGSYVVKHFLEEGYEVTATSAKEDASAFQSNKKYRFVQMDFTDAAQVEIVFEKVKPGVVIHCGAMSKPDDCEQNKQLADLINVDGTAHLMTASAHFQSHFIFLSTDFVFDGEKGMHKEDETANPVNYYGETKLRAEELVKGYKFKWSIVRTVFVYGKPLYGRDSFVSMIAKKLKNNESYKVVNDQFRTPTYAEDLTRGIGLIVQLKRGGVFHLCGKDILTPYEIAIKTASALQINNHQLQPVTCKVFKEIAKRPLNSGLNIDKARTELGYEPLSFDEALMKNLY
ncbi:MAG TPA: SDR family oxidoreductase [Niabella sp.]|nr:SDR family oxidoreductase [Chitinophagaceae bacterium]HRO85441.1 SDR family oxidoreductase [Niabella sp.]HUN02574.1 SDR family oxidoreductase [Niabella sp.]